MSSAVQAPLVPKTAEAAFQQATLTALGLQPNAAGYAVVRIAWQAQGQPIANPQTDAVILHCTTVDEEINKQRDVSPVVPNPNDPTGQTFVQTVTYIRVWNVLFECVGPDSFDNARQIHSALLAPNDVVHDLLSASQLWMVTDPACPRRVPEPWEGGTWRERTDFECRFNEFVTEQSIVGTGISVEVKGYFGQEVSINSPTFDITVEES